MFAFDPVRTFAVYKVRAQIGRGLNGVAVPERTLKVGRGSFGRDAPLYFSLERETDVVVCRDQIGGTLADHN